MEINNFSVVDSEVWQRIGYDGGNFTWRSFWEVVWASIINIECPFKSTSNMNHGHTDKCTDQRERQTNFYHVRNSQVPYKNDNKKLKIQQNSPYSKTTALGGVETGRQNAIETDTAQGIIKYMGLIWSLSAISHSRDAKIVIVDELEVTCVIRFIISTHKSNINGWERPKYFIIIYE